MDQRMNLNHFFEKDPMLQLEAKIVRFTKNHKKFVHLGSHITEKLFSAMEFRNRQYIVSFTLCLAETKGWENSVSTLCSPGNSRGSSSDGMFGSNRCTQGKQRKLSTKNRSFNNLSLVTRFYLSLQKLEIDTPGVFEECAVHFHSDNFFRHNDHPTETVLFTPETVNIASTKATRRDRRVCKEQRKSIKNSNLFWGNNFMCFKKNTKQIDFCKEDGIRRCMFHSAQENNYQRQKQQTQLPRAGLMAFSNFQFHKEEPSLSANSVLSNGIKSVLTAQSLNVSNSLSLQPYFFSDIIQTVPKLTPMLQPILPLLTQSDSTAPQQQTIGLFQPTDKSQHVFIPGILTGQNCASLAFLHPFWLSTFCGMEYPNNNVDSCKDINVVSCDPNNCTTKSISNDAWISIVAASISTQDSILSLYNGRPVLPLVSSQVIDTLDMASAFFLSSYFKNDFQYTLHNNNSDESVLSNHRRVAVTRLNTKSKGRCKEKEIQSVKSTRAPEVVKNFISDNCFAECNARNGHFYIDNGFDQLASLSLNSVCSDTIESAEAADLLEIKDIHKNHQHFIDLYSNREVTTHDVNIVNNIPKQCSECVLEFQSLANFNSHLISHRTPVLGASSRNKCGICSRVFTRSWLLKGHMRTHTGERPFHCSFPGCKKAFADKSNLRSHTLIHTTHSKSFACPSCARAFSQKRYLHKHMLEVCRII